MLDLVQAIKRSPLAVVLEVGADFHLFVASCEECGWNPIEALRIVAATGCVRWRRAGTAARC